MSEDKKYPPASLETAACLWEAVLEIEASGHGVEGLNNKVLDARSRIGTSGLRLTVLSWVDAADEDWAKVKTDLWDLPYDWEWIPAWILANVEWDRHYPELRSPRFIPGAEGNA